MILYVSSIAYYIMIFVCPFLLVRECGKGMQPAMHLIYAFYAMLTAALEIWIVRDI